MCYPHLVVEKNRNWRDDKNDITDFIENKLPHRLENDQLKCKILTETDLHTCVFSHIDKLTSPTCILATNTSSISINDIAKSTKTPQNVIGMHFMNPVPVMKLVEIIKGSRTDNSIVKKSLDYVSSIDKIPIECNDSPGFISNRILMPMINEYGT